MKMRLPQNAEKEPIFAAFIRLRIAEPTEMPTSIKKEPAHVQAYTKPPLDKIVAGAIDPSFVVTIRPNCRTCPRCTKILGRRTSEGWLMNPLRIMGNTVPSDMFVKELETGHLERTVGWPFV